MDKLSIPARDIVVIGASTGGVEALRTLISSLPSGFPAAVLVVMHIGTHDTILPSILARSSVLPVRQASDGDLIEPGRVFIAPPDLHLTVVRDGAQCRVVLTRSAKENYTRPAIDPLFRSAAEAFGARAIGVVLTGALDDGTAGLSAIKACGGLAVVQDPDEALTPEMPASAIANVAVDHVVHLIEIAPTLVRLVDANLRASAPFPLVDETPQWVQLENSFAIIGTDMDSLSKLATPSTFTCPECSGTLWELKVQRPRRFRCHTGHAYSERSLAALQEKQVEDSIWAAMRALQERMMFLRRMSEEALLNEQVEAASDYAAQATEAEHNAEVLRRLIGETT